MSTNKLFEYILLTLFLGFSQAEIVILYDDIDFKGSYIKIEFSGCYNLPREWNDRASSVNSYGMCIRLWEHGSCQGRSTDIAPGTQSHNNLVPLGFNDEISSLSPCKHINGSPSPPAGANPPQNGGSSNDWRRAALDLHNAYRSRHRVSPLRLDDVVNRSAQRCAEYLAARRIFDHVCKGALGHSYGENLAKRFEDDPKTAALESTKAFYKEESKHNYHNNFFQYASGHFSQLVWRDSQKLGLGFAKNGDFKIVVAHYDPPGNMAGQFTQNVPPSRFTLPGFKLPFEIPKIKLPFELPEIKLPIHLGIA